MLPPVSRTIPFLRPTFFRTPLLLAGALGLAALFGCGGSIGGYCNAAANCEGGNDLDEEACNVRLNETADVADLKNCGSEFDAYLTCLDENSRCNDEKFGPDDGVCAQVSEQLAKCIE